MPVKKKVDKKKKLKQKQKQKQIVKQNVKVTVQSSGGSGGGGSSVPSRFTDTSGENVRLQGLIEQLTRAIPAPVSIPVQQPVPLQFQAPAKVPKQRITVIKQPAESVTSFEEVSGKSQVRQMEEAIARAKLKAMEASSETPSFVGEVYNPNNDDKTVDNVFNQPNTNNNTISENIISNNLRKANPKAFEDNESDIQSEISEYSSYRGGGSYTPSIGSEVEFFKAGMEILKTGENLNKYIAEQRKKKPPLFSKEEPASFTPAKKPQEKNRPSSSPEFREPIGRPFTKLPAIQRAGASSLQVEESAPYGRFKNGNPRKSPSK